MRRPALISLSRAASVLCGALACLSTLFGSNALAQSGATLEGVGTVTHLSGTLTVRRSDGGTRFLSVKSGITEGDTLVTAQSTYARLRFSDGSEIVLRPDSQIKVDQFKFNDSAPAGDNMLMSLLKGGMRSVTGLLGKRSRDRVAFVTPNATIGIRGTHFGALLCQGDCASIATPAGGPPPNGLHLDVLDGSIAVRNNAGQQILNAGQFGFVRNTATPPAVVPSQQGILVTMPVAISRNTGAGATVGKARQDNECAIP